MQSQSSSHTPILLTALAHLSKVSFRQKCLAHSRCSDPPNLNNETKGRTNWGSVRKGGLLPSGQETNSRAPLGSKGIGQTPPAPNTFLAAAASPAPRRRTGDGRDPLQAQSQTFLRAAVKSRRRGVREAASKGPGFLVPRKSSRGEGEVRKLKNSKVVPESSGHQKHRGVGSTCAWPPPGQAPGDAEAAGRGPWERPRAPGIAGMAAGLGSPLRAMVPERHCEVAGAFLAVRGGSPGRGADGDGPGQGQAHRGTADGRNDERQAAETEAPETREPDRRPDRLTGDGRTG